MMVVPYERLPGCNAQHCTYNGVPGIKCGDFFVATPIWAYSKYMVASSLLFQIPAVYAYHSGIYGCSALSSITTGVSVNFWRHPTKSWRRNVDLCWSWSTGCFFLVQGLRISLRLSIVGLTCILWCYYQSGRQYKKDPLGPWYMYHMAFHAMAAANQCLIIYFQKNGLSSSVLS